jgi:hypothetical protein
MIKSLFVPTEGLESQALEKFNDVLDWGESKFSFGVTVH